MNTCDICNYFILFTFVYIISILLIVYILRLPLLITNQQKLINEYYYKNWLSSLHLDYFFIIIYLLIAYYFINLFEITNIWKQLIIVIITTIILTGLSAFYFISKPLTTSFFSRWFHSVKYTSIIYDSILIGFIFLIYRYLLNNKTNIL